MTTKYLPQMFEALKVEARELRADNERLRRVADKHEAEIVRLRARLKGGVK